MKAGRTPSHGGDPAPFASYISSSAARRKQEPPSRSHSTFGGPSSSSSPVRRKPLPPTASPLATRLSQSSRFEAIKDGNNAEDKPSAHRPSPTPSIGQSPITSAESPDFVVRDLDRYARAFTKNDDTPAHSSSFVIIH
ncbi:hypothetical protein GP486_001023 [Trichoglossum hirsutum]|uniref:Uncharacterized protein n=1 Tax=Trichoglossum hirsutum TaxID=265104 RepID=A0A9P8RSZ9_9PEZI|nr:hypothetical protein GP486_001023 [Trichoglossum hirsutum]